MRKKKIMSADKEIIIFGCGGHAKSIIDLTDSTNKFKIIGSAHNYAEMELRPILL